jgi:biotin operon repressor
MIVIGLSAGAATMAVNVAYGLKESEFRAFAFATADALKILLPLVAVLYGRWDPFRRTVWAIALAFSVYAALSFYLESSGQRLLNASVTDDERGASQHKLAEAERGLAAIAETGSAAALQALIHSAEDTAETEAKVAKASGIDKTQRKLYRAAIADRDKYMLRLAEAERRDALERQRGEAQAALGTIKPQALGMADNLAAMLGVSRELVARLDSMLGAIVAIILLECATYMPSYGLPWVITSRPKLVQKPQPAGHEELASTAPTDASAALFRLRLLILNSKGALTRSRRDLASELGIARSTLQDRIDRWRDAGLILTEPGPDGKTVFRLPDAA